MINYKIFNLSIFLGYKLSKETLKKKAKKISELTKDITEYLDENLKLNINLNSEKKLTNIDLYEYIDKIESSKPGEILLTSVDHDGMMKGYDIETIKKMFK